MIFLLTVALFAFSVPSFTQDYKVKKVGKAFSHPWGISVFDNDEVLITERGGNLFKVNIKNGSRLKISNLPEVFNVRQGGLLDVLVDKESVSERKVYICYSSKVSGGSSTTLMAGTLKEDKLISKKILFKSNNVSKSGVHFGCRLAILNDEIFMSIGDRGNRYEAQDVSSHAGSVIRVNKYDGATKERKAYNSWPAEVYTKGHRNPQGMAINSKTNEIWVNEHGPKGGDEINIIKPGKNYGWPIITYGINYSGTIITNKTSMNGMEQPLYYWVPSIAPSGMAFSTSNVYPKWKNSLFVGSLKFEYLERLEIKKEKVIKREKVLESIGRVRNVKEGPDGYLYVAVEGNGILKIIPN